MLVQRVGFPEAGAHLGHDGVRSYMRDFLSAWEHVTIAGEEFIGAGGSVAVGVRQEAVGAGSGVPGEFRYFHVWTFRGGKVIRIEIVRDRDEALAAIGRDA